jgi:hypothetical protein
MDICRLHRLTLSCKVGCMRGSDNVLLMLIDYCTVDELGCDELRSGLHRSRQVNKVLHAHLTCSSHLLVPHRLRGSEALFSWSRLPCHSRGEGCSICPEYDGMCILFRMHLSPLQRNQGFRGLQCCTRTNNVAQCHGYKLQEIYFLLI